MVCLCLSCELHRMGSSRFSRQHHSRSVFSKTDQELRCSGSESFPMFATYLEFVKLLKNNQAQYKKDPKVWKRKWQPNDWIKESILPSRTLIVMSIELQMPFECALALVAAVYWTMDIAQRRDANPGCRQCPQR